jgi:hypothetical protein
LQGQASAAAPTSSRAGTSAAASSSKKSAKKAAKSAKKQAPKAAAAGQAMQGTRFGLLQTRACKWANLVLLLAPVCKELQAELRSNNCQLLAWLEVRGRTLPAARDTSNPICPCFAHQWIQHQQFVPDVSALVERGLERCLRLVLLFLSALGDARKVCTHSPMTEGLRGCLANHRPQFECDIFARSMEAPWELSCECCVRNCNPTPISQQTRTKICRLAPLWGPLLHNVGSDRKGLMKRGCIILAVSTAQAREQHMNATEALSGLPL